MSQKALNAALNGSPTGKTFIYPNNLGSPGAEPFVLFTIRNPLDAGASQGNIGLYLPPSLQASYSADYEDFTMTFTKAASIPKGMLNSLVNAEGTAFMDQAAASGRMAIDNLAGAALGQDFKEMSYRGRVLVNPNQALLFKGMRFREFNFKFHFMPSNADESKQIKNIIYYFKRYMHPGQIGEQNAFFSYPFEFDIEFFSKSPSTPGQAINIGSGNNTDAANDDLTLFKMKRCVLMNCTVDYAGSGIPSFFAANGEPVDIRMDMTFKETSVLTRKDIEAGY